MLCYTHDEGDDGDDDDYFSVFSTCWVLGSAFTTFYLPILQCGNCCYTRSAFRLINKCQGLKVLDILTLRVPFQCVFPFTLFPILMVNIIMFFCLLPVLTIKMLPEFFYTFFLTIALALSFFICYLCYFFSVAKADIGDKITSGKEKVLRKGKRKVQILEILLLCQFGILRFKLKALGFVFVFFGVFCLFCFAFSSCHLLKKY